jgi:hypothetical protein
MPVAFNFPQRGVVAGLWGPNRTYEADYHVVCKGHLYRCRLAHTSAGCFKSDSLNGWAWIWLAKVKL